MLAGIKVLHVAFSVMFAAEFENFFLADNIVLNVFQKNEKKEVKLR